MNKRGGPTTPTEILQGASADGLILMPDNGDIVAKAPTWDTLERWTPIIKAHKQDLLKLLSLPPADVLSAAPCPICGSHERWIWLDGRHLCRPCVILDLAPLTLARQGWPEDAPEVGHG